MQQSKGERSNARGEPSDGAGERWLKMARVKEIGQKKLNCKIIETLTMLLYTVVYAQCSLFFDKEKSVLFGLISINNLVKT